jgi:hypothetical protein
MAYLWPSVDMEDRFAISSDLNVNLCNLIVDIGANLKSGDRTQKVPSLQSCISPSDDKSQVERLYLQEYCTSFEVMKSLRTIPGARKSFRQLTHFAQRGWQRLIFWPEP